MTAVTVKKKKKKRKTKKDRCLILKRVLKLLNCPHLLVYLVAVWMLKCTESDRHHILTSAPVSLTTLKSLSHTVSFIPVDTSCSSCLWSPWVGALNHCKWHFSLEVCWIAFPLWFHPWEKKKLFSFPQHFKKILFIYFLFFVQEIAIGDMFERQCSVHKL